MAENKKGFILYADQQEVFKALTDEQAGKLIKHILDYVNDESPISDDPIINLVFIPIKQQLKRDLEKWEKRAEKSRENGKKGGRPKGLKEEPKEPTGFIENLTEPKKPVNDNVNVNVTVNDNVNDNVNVIDNNTYVEIQRIYNDVCLSLPKIQKLSQTRKNKIKGFLKDNTLQDLGDLFKKVQASDFLTGRKTEWSADFDWIMKPANTLKIQEGNYDNKQKQNDLVMDLAEKVRLGAEMAKQKLI